MRKIASTFEVRGLVEKVTSYNEAGGVVNEVKNEFNGVGQLTRQYQECDGPQTAGSVSVQYAYDAAAAGGLFTKGSRPVSVTYPNGRVVNMNYGAANGAGDLLGRAAGINDGASAVVNYAYLGLGGFVITDLAEPQVKLDYTAAAPGDADAKYPGFDRFGRVVDQRWIGYGASPGDRDRFQYGYDRNSNRLFRANLTAQALGKPFDELYAYDRANRLVDFQRGTLNAQNTAISGTPTKAQTWGLDATGNWPHFTSATGGVTEVDQTRTHNQVNEITALSAWAPTAYDATGNMTRMPKPAEPTEGFAATYDAWNRLTKIREVDECGCPADTVAEYAYNGLNWRVKKVVPIAGGSETRRFYFTASWQCLEERVNGASFPERQYIWGLRYIDDLVLRDRDTNSDGSLDERLFPLQDANWNVTSLVNASGATQERYAYYPYGDSETLDEEFSPQAASAVEWSLRFWGTFVEPYGVGILIRERWLNTRVGRWLTRDPLGTVDGSNLYQQTAGNPINLIDGTGLASILCQCRSGAQGGELVWVETNCLGLAGRCCTQACPKQDLMLSFTGKWDNARGVDYCSSARLLPQMTRIGLSCCQQCAPERETFVKQYGRPTLRGAFLRTDRPANAVGVQGNTWKECGKPGIGKYVGVTGLQGSVGVMIIYPGMNKIVVLHFSGEDDPFVAIDRLDVPPGSRVVIAGGIDPRNQRDSDCRLWASIKQLERKGAIIDGISDNSNIWVDSEGQYWNTL